MVVLMNGDPGRESYRHEGDLGLGSPAFGADRIPAHKGTDTMPLGQPRALIRERKDPDT
jgi:hypothetical protein